MLDFFTILKLNGFPVSEAKRVYKDLLSIDDYNEWHKTKRREIARYHFENNDFYNNLLKTFPDEWEDIPIIRKKELQGDYRDIVPKQLGKRDRYISHTSGSTGNPLFYVRDKLSHVLIWLNVDNHLLRYGLSVNNKQARFYGIPLSKKQYYKERFKDFVSNRYRFVVFNLNDDIQTEWLRKFEKNKFEYIYGYTNSLKIFALFLIDNGFVLKDFCPSLRYCIVTAEVCSLEDENILKRAFGIGILNEYGTSETGVIGYKHEKYWRVSDELLYLEVVDDNDNILEDGRAGRLLCTLLFNKGTPIIRYETGDIASLKRENGKTYILSLEGRLSDMAILKSGKRIPGLTFYYILNEAIGDDKGIREFQVVQRASDGFDVNIVTNGIINADMKNSIVNAFATYLEEEINVNLCKVKKIDRTSSGKFKHFVIDFK